jgi:hypothetical protein
MRAFRESMSTGDQTTPAFHESMSTRDRTVPALGSLDSAFPAVTRASVACRCGWIAVRR